MKRSWAVCGAGRVFALVAAVSCIGAPPAAAQVPSLLDTMRIIDVPDARAGDVFDVDLYLRNVDTLGAYSVRLRYDPEAIQPVTDTQIVADDTTLTVPVQQLRGESFEIVGGGIPAPGVVTFVCVDLGHDALSLFLPGGGTAARMTWRAVADTVPTMTVIAFENDPVYPSSFNTVTDLRATIFKRPTLVDGTVTIGAGCRCDRQGDINLNGVDFEIGDVVLLSAVIFLGASQPASPDALCPVERGDVDCNGVIDVLDVLRMICIVTGDFPFPGAICDPCSVSSSSAVLTGVGGEQEAQR